jgi:hypothetical protein
MMSRPKGLFKVFVIASTLSFATVAQAVLPDNGWYWNKDESGRGFNIEIQNNLLFMSAFIYDAQGKPIWLVSGGVMPSDHTFSGTLVQTSDGQCVGCTFKPPVRTPYGTVTINFTGPKTATITINGIALQVERQAWGMDFSSPVTPLLGEWAIVDGQTAFPIYFGERIAFQSTQVINGTPYAVGNRAGQSGGDNVAIGRFDASIGMWLVLLDSSTSYWKAYTWTYTAFDRVEGTEYVYLKGSSPTGGLASIGNRIKSAAAVSGLNAPGTGKAFLLTSESEILAERAADDEAHHVGSLKTSIQASGEVKALLLGLEGTLRAIVQ